MKQIKENIKAELKSRGMTVGKLCEKIGKDRFFVYRMTENAPVSKLKLIAHGIGCELQDLFKGV